MFVYQRNSTGSIHSGYLFYSETTGYEIPSKPTCLGGVRSFIVLLISPAEIVATGTRSDVTETGHRFELE